jgi:hypothetical protein
MDDGESCFSGCFVNAFSYEITVSVDGRKVVSKESDIKIRDGSCFVICNGFFDTHSPPKIAIEIQILLNKNGDALGIHEL